MPGDRIGRRADRRPSQIAVKDDILCVNSIHLRAVDESAPAAPRARSMNPPPANAPDVWTPLGIALGLGLLVGLQREWAKSGGAGIRTFPSIALLGTLCTFLAETWPTVS